ncbi:MAG: PKD domain-containing protein [Candidatus Thermoplasmatota archaeon]|nr:PKD domain-containing protein [Candidatus Thermoplasmatota archaeon]
MAILTAVVLVLQLVLLPCVIGAKHQTVYGYVDYSDGSPVPNGVAVLITNPKTGDNRTQYTTNAVGGHTGLYHLDVFDIDADEGDIVYVNVSYGGCEGNNSVTVGKGPSKICNVTITGNLPPIVPEQPSGETAAYKNTVLAFSTQTTDPDNPADQVKYGWDWSGDDAVDEWTEWYDSGETCNMTHAWQQAGTYPVKVKAKDVHGAERGLAWSDALTVTISNPPGTDENEAPTASFSYTPTNPLTDETITFTDASTDDGTIVNWTWDFGDDTGSYEQNPAHAYTDEGSYVVVLAVTDNENESDTTQQTITVTEEPATSDWEQTEEVTLAHSSQNNGINYLVWRGAAINVSALAEKAQLSAGESISIFDATTGEWLTYIVGESSVTETFIINPWDVIIIYSTSMKTISVDISAQDNIPQSLRLSYSYDEESKTGNSGYNFFAWPGGDLSITTFVTSYDLAGVNIEISIYGVATSSWKTYNPSLPADFQDTFDIHRYDIVCIKLSQFSKERTLII